MKFLRLTVALSAGLILLAFSLKEKFLTVHSNLETSAAEEISGSENPLDTARQLAWKAAVLVQHPPHSVDTWQQAKVTWRQAIRLLESIPAGTAEFAQAQQRLSLYRANYQAISDRLQQEQTAMANLKAAQTLAWQAAVTAQNPPHPLRVWQRASQKWQAAIALLEPIPQGTSVSTQSREKLTTYRNNRDAINQQLALETQALSTLKQFATSSARLSQLPSTALAGLTPDQVGIRYQEYATLVQTLDTAFVQLANQPKSKSHPVYPALAEALDDYKFALKLWKGYLEFEQENAQWLYDNLINQMAPVSPEDSIRLAQKYGVKSYFGGTKVSLRFSIWEVWNHATEQVNKAREATHRLN